MLDFVLFDVILCQFGQIKQLCSTPPIYGPHILVMLSVLINQPSMFWVQSNLDWSSETDKFSCVRMELVTFRFKLQIYFIHSDSVKSDKK